LRCWVAPNTAKSWISILKASQQIFLLEPYHSSAGKRLIKTPKLYFSDSCLLTYLLGFSDWKAVINSPAWGSVWENLVISEVHKHFLNRGKRPPCLPWRTAQGEEVDLLVEIGPRRFLAMECKTSAQIQPRALKWFLSLEKMYGPDSMEKGAVVCRSEEAYPLAKGGRVVALPLCGAGGLTEWLEQ